MSDAPELRAAGFPVSFIPFLFPLAQVEVFYRWLDFEVDRYAEIHYPVLQEIRGHRRREVMKFMDADAERRDRMICLHLYGNMPVYEEGWAA